ncbi:C4b-binding protein alpha chain-like isoform X2 [Anoplopoma fimbria]|uniref:C4b-binding protein alpha chain-like isoform X2 n=1 Tax=Anoplopoma fimbria TaxID=229290 RepID=UPI0023ED3513|nr:C4b-binding protein alpha chain-like isoform X2 [Anoplopoma fimbria]
MVVTFFLLLSSLGLAIQAQNCPVPVGGPHMTLKGEDILLQTFPDGTQVSFACDVGYVSAGGSPIITCTAGSWSTVRLTCEKSNCGPAGEVLNGNVDYPEGTEFGAQLVVTCNPGHKLVGSSKILCGAQGWMDRLPECEVVTCDKPVPVVAGSFSPSKEVYEYREVIQYTCEKDYTLNGSKSASCSENGMFKPAPPKCIKVQCEDPTIAFSEFVQGSRPPHGYLATVTYRCISGYTMDGKASLTCGIDGRWLPGLPTCLRIPTTTKSTTTKSTTTKSTTTKSTTTSSSTTKETIVNPGTTPPGNTGNGRAIGLGVGLSVLIVSVLTICGCYFCGVPAMIKEKRRKRHNPVAPALLALKTAI